MRLRECIERLEKEGELLHVRREVSRTFELAAVSKKLDGSQAAIFERVQGASMPVLIGTDGTKERIARNLGLRARDLGERFRQAIEQPIPPKPAGDGPVREKRVSGAPDLDVLLPVVHHYEKEPAPFITNGIVVARDPDSGVQNASFNRLQLKGGARTGILIQPRHLFQIYEKNRAQGKATDVAVVIGTETAVRLASATWGTSIPLELDEFAIAGGLRGEPLEVVRCETMDLVVPADAEIVLEGRILPGALEEEGPMAEFTGVYGGIGPKHVMEFHAMMMREDALYQDLLPFTNEHHLLLSLPYEPVLSRTVRGMIPGLKDVYITPGGCGKFYTVLSIKKQHDGDAKNAIIVALSAIRDIKVVIVVDEDIDVNNPKEVEYAIATRVQGDRDVLLLPGCKGNELDPIQDVYDYVTKIGIDATKPLDKAARFELARIPGYDTLDLKDYL
ncbi:MAG: UbiD family decarboxylase [Deltaproteobacteria bacterium]|nr:UbiD family decarboxylase [Deltaproteobacteria bacterium]